MKAAITLTAIPKTSTNDVEEAPLNQGTFLNDMNGKSVNVFLISGIKLTGTIKASDNYSVFIADRNCKLQLVYKHAIATIVPVDEFAGLI